MQVRPKLNLGVSAAAGSLIAGAALMIPGSASAAAGPTFDIIPLRTAYGPVTLTGTAEPGDTVSLYEYAYVWGYNYTKDQLSREPSVDYTNGGFVTTRANSSTGRWSITRNLDSGHVMMVGTNDGYSQIRLAPLRVKADLNATVSGTTVNFTVSVDPSQPGLPVAIQRYDSGTWTQVASGATAQISDGAAQYTGSATGQPAGTSYYRAFLQGTDTNWADKSNYIVANYSENQSVTVGNGANHGTPPGNPLPTPVYDTGVVVTPPPTTPTPTPTPTTPKPTATTPTPTPTATTPAGPVKGSVQFTRIQYNAPGVDKKTDKSINGEYFRLTNKTKKAINVQGWIVRDAAGNLYRFTSGYSLGAGKSVTVRTGKGTNSTAARYWGKTNHVWNNGGDTAYLSTSAAGTTIDTCNWTKAGTGYTSC